MRWKMAPMGRDAAGQSWATEPSCRGAEDAGDGLTRSTAWQRWQRSHGAPELDPLPPGTELGGGERGGEKQGANRELGRGKLRGSSGRGRWGELGGVLLSAPSAAACFPPQVYDQHLREVACWDPTVPAAYPGPGTRWGAFLWQECPVLGKEYGKSWGGMAACPAVPS